MSLQLMLLILAAAAPTFGQSSKTDPSANTTDATGELSLGRDHALPEHLLGRAVTRFEITAESEVWLSREVLEQSPVGKPLSARLARDVMRQLLATGRYANARCEAVEAGGQLLLRAVVTPRRVVADLQLQGGVLDFTTTTEAAQVEVGRDVTLDDLPQIEQRVTALYRARGFPDARVRVVAAEGERPLEIVLHLSVEEGAARPITLRQIRLHPRPSPELVRISSAYAVDTGDRADERQLEEADTALTNLLQASGYPQAAVSHHLTPARAGAVLQVSVWAGPRVKLSFWGNDSFDSDALREYLLEEELEELSARQLQLRLEAFYVRRGFLDASVRYERRATPDDSLVVLRMIVDEGPQVRVSRVHFPCLSGERSEADLKGEIDSFLTESLPGASLIGAVDPNQLDRHLGSSSSPGWTAAPVHLDPWNTYDPATYDQALEHLTALYRSEGYLSAEVGPLRVVRGRCDPSSPADGCVELPLQLPAVQCDLEREPFQEEPGESECTSEDREHGLCAHTIQVQIPVRLGPRALLWDIGFEGNQLLVEQELRQVTGLRFGGPVSQIVLEDARRRVVERYAEEGFAFAGVEVELQLSSDRTRAKAMFQINERQPVRVRDIVIQGARFTQRELIESRTALKVGEPYRSTWVRATEEQLATLGVFTSITVALEDPQVPARDKVVKITVQERLPQYLDLRPGFSTGQGFRFAAEYGHRNLLERAVRFGLAVQLGYLPPPLILDESLRTRFERVLEQESVFFLLSRRLSATLEFPEVGLGPPFRLGVEGLDTRLILRDMALDKRAAITTLSYRQSRQFSMSLGASLEFNELAIIANIISDEEEVQQRDDVYAGLGNNALISLLNVPEGFTMAVAQSIGLTWDRRDNPVAATQGTFLSLNVEHVNALPIGERNTDFESHFLHITGRIAGYLRLNQRGLALATSLFWGWNKHLNPRSTTYPDRLFYLGGGDSLRGTSLYSVIPEDTAQDIIQQRRAEDGSDEALSADDVVFRGGDFLLNPRAELRIPIIGAWQTAVFLDTGNLWLSTDEVWREFRLRYTAGVGLRWNTPVGPLALDFGFNLAPRLDETPRQLHFSIGLF